MLQAKLANVQTKLANVPTQCKLAMLTYKTCMCQTKCAYVLTQCATCKTKFANSCKTHGANMLPKLINVRTKRAKLHNKSCTCCKPSLQTCNTKIGHSHAQNCECAELNLQPTKSATHGKTNLANLHTKCAFLKKLQCLQTPNLHICKQRLHLFNRHQPLQHKQFLQVCRQRVHSSCVAKARFCNVCNTKSAHVQTMPIYEPSPHMLLPKFFNCCTLGFKMYTSCFAKWRTKRANVYTHIAQSANQVCPSAQTLLYEDRTAKLTSQVCSCAK